MKLLIPLLILLAFSCRKPEQRVIIYSGYISGKATETITLPSGKDTTLPDYIHFFMDTFNVGDVVKFSAAGKQDYGDSCSILIQQFNPEVGGWVVCEQKSRAKSYNLTCEVVVY